VHDIILEQTYKDMWINTILCVQQQLCEALNAQPRQWRYAVPKYLLPRKNHCFLNLSLRRGNHRLNHRFLNHRLLIAS